MTDNTGLARARGKSRRLAMQAIYQWQMTADDIDGIRRQFIEENDMNKVDHEYFDELLYGASGQTAAIDAELEQHMGRKMKEVDPVERAILRIACYELVNRLDVPFRVILNEAVVLTKKFCAENSHAFVNAVLDKAARSTRSLETAR